jgi:hypothetical protein
MITRVTVRNCEESHHILTDIQDKIRHIYDAISPILGPDRTRLFIRNLRDICDYYIKKACVEEKKIHVLAGLADRYRGLLRQRIGLKLEKQRVANRTTAVMANKINAEWEKLCKAIRLYKEDPDRPIVYEENPDKPNKFRKRGYYLSIAQVEDTLASQVKMLTGSNGFMMHPR